MKTNFNSIVLKAAAVVSMAIVGSGTLTAQNRLYGNEFALGDVRLLDGPFRKARDLNIEVLLQYDTDRLLAPYLKEAGLKPKKESFPNWDGLDGHVGGHYLSALSISYAATGDPRLKERIDYMISELGRAQKAGGTGYVGGVPDSRGLWPEITAGNVGRVWKYWVPWYNVHKIYAGLRDAWLYAGNGEARRMFLEMCDWGLGVIAGLTDEQMEKMLDCEFGGMNEVYADAYAMTGDARYLDAARRFSHKRLFDSMCRDVDNLDNMHANTQVPKAVGYQRVAELSGDCDYREAARFFWQRVADTRSLSFGGNSRREHFPSADDCVSYTEEREGPETCNTNNMLKLTEGLFRMNPDAHYADFYERALFNHILSSQHPEHGGYVYFTPARPAHYRVYSRPNCAMWCCVGTGMENHGKYGQFIYTHEGNDTLRVNLFVPSELNWKEKGVRVTQRTDFPKTGHTKLSIDGIHGHTMPMTLALRYPEWAEGMTVKVNGERVELTSGPSSYVMLSRRWKNGDVVEMEMPMKIRLEEMPNVPQYVSILRGPIVLAQRMGTDNLDGLIADDSRMGHIAHGPEISVYDTPVILGSREEIERKLSHMRADSTGTRFIVPGLFGAEEDAVLEPFSAIHDCRYMLYWLSLTPEQYAAQLDDLQKKEEARRALEAITVDAVNSGEQQPEADHFMSFENSQKGVFRDRPWRDAADGGYFSYLMKTGGATELALMVSYWGNEGGGRAFDIEVGDTVIASENLSGKWNRNDFVDVVYTIPGALLENKDKVTVAFRPHPGNRAGGVYHVRLINKF